MIPNSPSSWRIHKNLTRSWMANHFKPGNTLRLYVVTFGENISVFSNLNRWMRPTIQTLSRQTCHRIMSGRVRNTNSWRTLLVTKSGTCGQGAQRRIPSCSGNCSEPTRMTTVSLCSLFTVLPLTTSSQNIQRLRQFHSQARQIQTGTSP